MRVPRADTPASSGAPQVMALCSCKRVAVEASGPPITCLACYCDSCQEAGLQFAAMPQATHCVDPDGGTQYIVYRKDRVRCVRGREFLKRYKLRDESPTIRVLATCCNSAMFLTFDDSKHWVDLYRIRCDGHVPPLRMRVCTRFAPDSTSIPDDAPRFPGYPRRFVLRLILAKFRMAFGSDDEDSLL